MLGRRSRHLYNVFKVSRLHQSPRHALTFGNPWPLVILVHSTSLQTLSSQPCALPMPNPPMTSSQPLVSCNTSCSWKTESWQHIFQVQLVSLHPSLCPYGSSMQSRRQNCWPYTKVQMLEVFEALKGPHLLNNGEELSKGYPCPCPWLTCCSTLHTGTAANVIFAKEENNVSFLLCPCSNSMDWCNINFTRTL